MYLIAEPSGACEEEEQEDDGEDRCDAAHARGLG